MLYATATCVPAVVPPSGPSDSDRLAGIQVEGTRAVSARSASAISQAVFGAIDGTFSPGQNTLTFGANGASGQFYVAPAATGTSALSAIGSADTSSAHASPDLNLWANVREAGIVRSDASVADIDGAQVNVTAGIGYALLPDLTIGLFAGYEAFGYEFAALSGQLDGHGGTLGSYAGWLLAPGLRWDVLAGWTGLSYDASAGGADGSFTGSRWLAATALSGQYELGDFTIEPTLNAQAVWEHQSAWTDSLAVDHAARDAAMGIISIGGRVFTPSLDLASLTIKPFVGLYGDWHVVGTDALPGGVDAFGLAKGWSARLTGGLDLISIDGGSLGVSAEYGGLGSDYNSWAANMRAGWAF